MTGCELEFAKFSLEERRAVPSEFLVLRQQVPDDDRQLARGCDCRDMLAALLPRRLVLRKLSNLQGAFELVWPAFASADLKRHEAYPRPLVLDLALRQPPLF
jgi:hypothetical protein